MNFRINKLIKNHLVRAVVGKLTLGLILPNNSGATASDCIAAPAKTVSGYIFLKSFIIGVLMLVVGVGSMNGATKTASGSGNWSNTATWGGAVPTSSDDVVIPNGYTVTMDANPGYCNNLLLNNNAYLTWSGNGTLNISGNLTNNNWSGLLTPGNGTINFTGNSSAINGSAPSQTFNNIIVSKTAGQTLSYSGSTTSVTLNGDFTLSSGTFSSGTTLTVSGNWNNNGGTFTPGTGTVTMNGFGKQIQGSASTTFNGLTIGSGNNATISLGIDQTTVNGTLTLTNGLLTLGAYNLILGTLAPAVSGSFSKGNMIVADGTGQVRKLFNSASSYTFPIGDSTPNYSPITLNFASQGTFATGAYAGVTVTNAKHPQNTSPVNYLNRYWSVSQSGITGFSCTVTGNYSNSYHPDVAGQENLSTVVEYKGYLPWILYPTTLGSGGAGTLTATGVTTFGDFTGMGSLSLTTTVSSLDGFTYVHNTGPSTPKSFNVTALNTSNNVIITAPADFEVSLSYTGGYGSTITLTPTNGNVASTIIYVHLKAGLAVGNYSNENVVCTTTGLTPVNVQLTNATVTSQTSCSPAGDMSNLYSITRVKFGTSIDNSTGKTVGYTDYTSTQSTDLVIGNTYQLIVNVNTNGNNRVGAKVWIDWNNSGLITNSDAQAYDLGIATNSGSSPNCPLSITVPSTASIGKIKMRVACLNYNSPSNICDNNSEVEDYSLNIVAPSINVIASLTGFSYPLGTGPSSEKTFTVGGTYLTSPLTITPPTDYEISKTSGTGYGSSITLTPTSETVATTIIYARLKAGLAAGNYANEDIVCASDGATTKNAVCSGTVVDNYDVITTTSSSLTGFTYYHSVVGPSAEQTFTVSGVNLTSNLTITPSADYEISKTSGTGYGSSITLTPTSETVATTTIYARLKAGLAIGSYAENIVCTSTGAATQNVTVSGTVTSGTFYSVANSNWNTSSTWSLTSGGTPITTGYPQAGDIVVIENGHTVTLGAAAACADITISSGATLGSGAYTLTTSGNWTNNGTFTAGTGTVTFNGTAAQTIAGSATTTFYNLTISKGAAATTVTSQTTAFAVGNILTVTQGNLILQATDNNYNIASDLIVSTTGTLTHSVDWSTGHLLQVGGNIAIDGTFTYPVSRSHVHMTGSGKSIRTGTSPSALGILTLANPTGAANAISASGPVTVNDNFWSSTNAGTFATNGNTVTANLTLFCNNSGTVNINGGTLNVTGGLSLANSTPGNVVLSSGTLNADGVNIGDGTVSSTFTQSGGTANISGSLTINGSSSYTCTGSPTITLGGDWTNNGTFTSGTGTVSLNGASQTIGGATATTFNVLTLGGSGTKTLGSAITTNGTLTVNTGVTLSTSIYLVTLTGNLVNNGTVSGSIGGVTITGTTAQSIGAFTTTGSATMTKTGGTATLTGAISATALIVNGTGGTLNLGTSTGHTIQTTTITAGTLTLGTANALPDAMLLNIGGGTISTGTTTGYSETIGMLNVTANSTLALGTGSHTLSFAASNAMSWTGFALLTITGWTGGYNGTSSATAGKIFVGTSSSGLTATQLSQIIFYNGSKYYTATQLSTGEVVPTATIFTPTLSYTSPVSFVAGTTITPLTPTVNFPITSYSVSPALPGLTLNTTTGVISGTPTGTATSTYTVTATGSGGSTATFPIIITVRAAKTYYSIANGNWNTNIWSTSSGGSVVSGIYPLAGDAVNIERGYTVTVAANAACLNLNFATATTGALGILTVNSGSTLAVSNAVTLNNAATASVSASISGGGTLTCASVSIGNSAGKGKNNTYTHTLTSTITALTISGNLTVNSYYLSYSSGWNNYNTYDNGVFIQQSGNVTVNGQLKTTNTSAVNTSTYTLGSSSPALILGAASPFSISNSGTSTLTFNVTGATVNYNGAAQTIGNYTYANLTLSGSGVKTVNTATVNGILSMEGTATLSGTPTYGTAATLQYKGSAAQTTGTEFQTPFPGSGGLVINNTYGVTLSAAKSISLLTLTNGTLTTTSTNLPTITSTATSAIMGGSATSFINGPVIWTLPTNLGSGYTYYFPVGKGTSYLPFSLVNPTTGSATTPKAQVEAFASNSSGTADGSTVSDLSTSEYWHLTTTGSYTNSSVSVSRPTAITPYNVIASSTSAIGYYNSRHGAYDTYGVSNSDATTDNFFVLATGLGASMNVNTNVLHGFNYSVGSGPSNELSFKVSGTSLTGNITVTSSSTNYEISTVSGGIFNNSLTILPVSGQVSATIYVREVTGLSVGNYTSVLTIASSNSQFTAKSINCYGTVVPVITVGGSGSYCVGGLITLTNSTVSDQYWTGPNNYYTTLQSPTIANATTAMTGTYTVYGSTTTGSNLVVDGNFESGGVSNFTTSYTRNTSTLVPEGTYNVIKIPFFEHSNFCSCGDHTSGSGYQMVVNGAASAQKIWEPVSLITVTPYTDYQFTYWVQTVDPYDLSGTPDPSPSVTQLQINGVNAGPSYTANDTTGIWTQFLYNWNSGPNTTADLVLMSENTVAGGNDFALDDIQFYQVYTSSASVNVTVVSTNIPASVSISSSPNPSSAGQSVTLTATPTNGGTAPTYQWSVNGTPVSGATNSTYTYFPTNGDVVTCTMASNSGCASGNPVSSSVTMAVTTVKNLWIGTKGTNWGTASNWTAGYVPGKGDNIEFATTSNYTAQAISNLTLDIDRTIGSLTNATTNPIRQLIIPSAKCLTVNGNITAPDTNPSRIYIQTASDGTQQNGSFIFPNTSSPVYGTVDMYARGSYNATGTFYGGTTYHYTWQYFGIPVSTITADPTFYGSYVRRWKESGDSITNHWIQLGNSDQLTPFTGYELTQNSPKIITFQGQLQNGPYTSSYLARDAAPALFPGQYIFANPYTAAIDIQQFISRLGDDTDGSVYLYSTGSYADWGNATATGTNAGQYQVVTSAAGTGIPTQIPSMQAVIIQVVTGGLSTSSVTFNYSDVIKNSSLQRVKEVTDSTSSGMPYTLIDIAGSGYSDRMWIFTDSTFTHRYDRGWDGKKMLGTALAPQLYALEQDGNNYQIDCVDDMNNTMLAFQRGVDTKYKLTFTHQNISSKYAGVYLVDLVEDKTVDITESGSTYSFVADSTSTPVKRFLILTRSNEEVATNAELKLFNTGNTIFIQNLGNQTGEMIVYDMMGHVIKRATFGPYGVTAVKAGAIPGAYVIKATTGNERVTKKVIIGE